MVENMLSDQRANRRAVIAATTGNALEFYDFETFGFFAIQIGSVFFPAEDPFVSLMGSLATFGVGFVGRPLGAWAIGLWADRHGRKPAMHAAITESLPKAARARTFALIYALPVTICGGSTQLVVTWLLKVTGDPMAPAWYMAGAACVTMIAMLLMKESAPARLRLVPA